MPTSASRTTAFQRILILFILLLLYMSVAIALQMVWLGPSLSLEIPIAPAVRWMQLITTVVTFLLPALTWALFARQVSHNPLSTPLPKPQIWLLYGLAVALLMAMPNALLTELNESLPIPQWASNMDKQVEETSKALLSVNSLAGYLTNVIVIAIAPAVCEEFFFRGALQHDLLRLMRNQHAAIWIGATIFSLIHFQLSGFVPRLALGASLGYLAFYSRSIWPAVIMHFANNFFALSLAAIAFRNGDITQFDHPAPAAAWPIASLSMALIVLFFARAEKGRRRDI